MAVSSSRSALPARSTQIPVSPRRTMSPQTPRQSHVSVTRPGETSPSRMPRVLLDSRTALEDIQNILPEAPRLSRRPPTRWVSKQAKSQLRPLSTMSFSQPLTARSSPAASPLAISKREDASRPTAATIYGHVRSRHKMESPQVRKAPPVIPPFKASPTKKRQTPGLPVSSSVTASRSFDLLKESIMDGYYQPSASFDSLATVRCLSDDRRQLYEDCRSTEYRSVHPSQASSRNDGVPKSAPQTNCIRFPIRAGPVFAPAPEHPSKQPRLRPTLTSPEPYLPPLLAGRTQDKFPPTNMRIKDEAIGFPLDMLDILNTLEMLASKVKTLEMPGRKGYGGVSKQDTGEKIKEYRAMPTTNFLPVATVPSSFHKLEKGKWRSIEPDVQDPTSQASSAPEGVNKLHLGFLSTQMKPTKPECSNAHGYLYNPYNAPEFLAGCSTSLVLYRAYGYRSRPTITHQHPPCRKLSLPSRLPLPKPQGTLAPLAYFWQPEQRTASASILPASMYPSISPTSPSNKSSTLKSLLQRSRPRSRSDVIPKPVTLSIPISHHPVENLPRRLPKPRFYWLKF